MLLEKKKIDYLKKREVLEGAAWSTAALFSIEYPVYEFHDS